MGIPVLPILNPSPTSLPIPSLRVIQCTSPEHPVSCIKPGLAIHFTYDILHVSMPFSHIIPPSSSLDWRSISHMVIYMFQCYSLKSIYFEHLIYVRYCKDGIEDNIYSKQNACSKGAYDILRYKIFYEYQNIINYTSDMSKV